MGLLSDDKEYVDGIKEATFWTFDVGDGNVGELNDGCVLVDLPPSIIDPMLDNPIASIVHEVYPNLEKRFNDPSYFTERVILSTINEVMWKLNGYVCSLFPREEHVYLSADSISLVSQGNDSFEQLYLPEFLNSINSSSLPPHRLVLKVGMPVMLLHNIDQSAGLCNGTRLVICHLGMYAIQAKALSTSNKDDMVVIH
ncbi:uncharacterized protein LOC129302653 [Prosopis cineraria]|uniref:uncharacterized protein LOC129302653 n=1 Tax=Prosopis cineraria TaxID=364024 RepID=UPI00240ED86B|nr:uncharacterized protein LOC129302653 [Prosopis cineraria]